jgi:hypothetical protein
MTKPKQRERWVMLLVALSFVGVAPFSARADEDSYLQRRYSLKGLRLNSVMKRPDRLGWTDAETNEGELDFDEDEEELSVESMFIKLIEKTVSPGSWQSEDARIALGDQSLSVYQTLKVHKELRLFLDFVKKIASRRVSALFERYEVKKGSALAKSMKAWRAGTLISPQQYQMLSELAKGGTARRVSSFLTGVRSGEIAVFGKNKSQRFIGEYAFQTRERRLAVEPVIMKLREGVEIQLGVSIEGPMIRFDLRHDALRSLGLTTSQFGTLGPVQKPRVRRERLALSFYASPGTSRVLTTEQSAAGIQTIDLVKVCAVPNIVPPKGVPSIRRYSIRSLLGKVPEVFFESDKANQSAGPTFDLLDEAEEEELRLTDSERFFNDLIFSFEEAPEGLWKIGDFLFVVGAEKRQQAVKSMIDKLRKPKTKELNFQITTVTVPIAVAPTKEALDGPELAALLKQARSVETLSLSVLEGQAVQWQRQETERYLASYYRAPIQPGSGKMVYIPRLQELSQGLTISFTAQLNGQNAAAVSYVIERLGFKGFNEISVGPVTLQLPQSVFRNYIADDVIFETDKAVIISQSGVGSTTQLTLIQQLKK